ncbi:MAG: HlyC/CorC family transporter [Cyanobacteria bacterium]|nr:HlyC/CorC family transporter [Cyanobacteria bacterium CG_2015-16_32_12]NCO76912.1 HlyC/CorC family transporter [Cyanobacteria bacterium CG_2015-22_32_23]NCQ05700.1 HlyC/CorC family transporter [Cyanobacteria bacterium CG_2015-09_32_10]NCQ41427.1 HlyC/CorC family transporter [Cyanobacteria bacterium CG_2015-04_32_10]NCS84947.1 HlyC/CorC family transporter [Cyanobacteria bacterium CG_2015-02_32_10]
MIWHQLLFRLCAIFLLIFINAFFVMGEFAIVSVRRSRIDHLVIGGDIPAQTVQSLQKSLDRLLSTTQLGITLSSLALGWIGEGTMAISLQYLISFLPFPQTIIDILTHSISIPLAFFLLVYLQIVLGELCPKSLALLYPEQLARFLAAPIIVIGGIFKPFIDVLNQSTRFLLKLIGIQYTGQGWYKQVTPEELQLIIKTERDSSGLEAEERELLSNVFEFGDVEASEVMTPRVNIKALDLSATYGDLWVEVSQTRHSHYPIIGDSLDDIRGIVNFKDCVSTLENNSINLNISLEDFVKPARFVPESTSLSELLAIMQQSPSKMVIIVDDYGGTSGLVTMQDLIDEILGGDQNQDDDDNFNITVIDEQNFLISAQINLEELNDLLDFTLPLVDEYQTLGGFLVYHWQKIPKESEIFNFDNLQFTVMDVDGPRINKIKITIQDQ